MEAVPVLQTWRISIARDLLSSSLSAQLILVQSFDLLWSERLEAKWLPKDLLDLAMQQERAGAFVKNYN
jgi:hypothetical protein